MNTALIVLLVLMVLLLMIGVPVGFAIGGAGLGVIGSNLFIRRHLKV